MVTVACLQNTQRVKLLGSKVQAKALAKSRWGSTSTPGEKRIRAEVGWKDRSKPIILLLWALQQKTAALEGIAWVRKTRTVSLGEDLVTEER